MFLVILICETTILKMLFLSIQIKSYLVIILGGEIEIFTRYSAKSVNETSLLGEKNS